MKNVFCLICVLSLMFLFSSAVADIEIHFLDVGQGDSALIMCDGEAMLVDGGSSDKSSYVFSYLKNTVRLDHIDYVIASHPHEDHIGGLSAALNACSVEHVFSPVSEYQSREFESLQKYARKQNVDLEIPNTGDVFFVGGASVTVLSDGIMNGNENDLSIVLRLDYGNTSVLFTGDAELGAEADLLQAEHNINVDVLKVAHHGSDTSSHRDFLNAVLPSIAVISVGEGNQYEHPSDWVLSDLNLIGADIYRTDLHGTIIINSDGNTVSIDTEKDRPIKSIMAKSERLDNMEEYPYIGNKNSKKLHHDYCDSVDEMSDKNKVGFLNKEDAMAAGYESCQRCMP